MDLLDSVICNNMNCCTDLMASRSALLPNYINFGTEEPLVSGSEVVQRGKFLPVGIFYRNMVVLRKLIKELPNLFNGEIRALDMIVEQ